MCFDSSLHHALSVVLASILRLSGSTPSGDKISNDLAGQLSGVSLGIKIHIWRFPKMGLPWATPKSSILVGFSTMNHPFWGSPICGNPMSHQSNPVNMAAQSAPVISMRLSLSGETCCSAQQYSILISRTLNFHCTVERDKTVQWSKHAITISTWSTQSKWIEMVSTSQTAKPDQGARRC